MLSNQQLERRGFIKLSGAAAATVALGMASFGKVAYGAALTSAQREKLTPDQIIALMKDGNQRFRLGKESPHDYLSQRREGEAQDVELFDSGDVKCKRRSTWRRWRWCCSA